MLAIVQSCHLNNNISMRLLAVVCLLAATATLAVDRTKFRKCSDTSFCRRHRDTKPEDKVRLAMFHVELVPC